MDILIILIFLWLFIISVLFLRKKASSEIKEEFYRIDDKINSQYQHNVGIIKDITEKLVNLERTNKEVVDFSEKLSNLEKILTNQKDRGNLGEVGLQIVLENILPPNAFSLQYSFSDDTRVDAVIFTKGGMIPVDAKFSYNNYQKATEEKDLEKKKFFQKEFRNDIKKRIEETSKYIKVSQGTLDFAFMFIPAEGIYYDILSSEVGGKNLINYAFNDKRVIIVSPTTFAAYLLTVLQGLRAFQIEESAKSIRKNVEKLGIHMKRYESFITRLGSSMSTSVNHYNSAYKEFAKIDKDIIKITGEGEKVVPKEVDSPNLEE